MESNIPLMLAAQSAFLSGPLPGCHKIFRSTNLVMIHPNYEPPAKDACSVIPANAGIQDWLKNLDSGSRFACPE